MNLSIIRSRNSNDEAFNRQRCGGMVENIGPVVCLHYETTRAEHLRRVVSGILVVQFVCCFSDVAGYAGAGHGVL